MRNRKETDKLYDYWSACIKNCDPNDKTYKQANIVMGKLLHLEEWDILYDKYNKSSGILKMYYRYLIKKNEETL